MMFANQSQIQSVRIPILLTISFLSLSNSIIKSNLNESEKQKLKIKVKLLRRLEKFHSIKRASQSQSPSCNFSTLATRLKYGHAPPFANSASTHLTQLVQSSFNWTHSAGWDLVVYSVWNILHWRHLGNIFEYIALEAFWNILEYIALETSWNILEYI